MARYDEKGPRLETYSQQFAKRLLARHPEWRPFWGSYRQIEDGLQVSYLEVKLPSQNPAVPEPFVIQTRPGQEVLVYWMEGFHSHIQIWPRQDIEAHYDEALRIIDSILSDDYVIGIELARGRVASSINGPLDWLDRSLEAVGDADLVVLRSWRGTHDREIRPKKPGAGTPTSAPG